MTLPQKLSQNVTISGARSGFWLFEIFNEVNTFFIEDFGTDVECQ
jgi:hypothetical protein